MQTYQDILAPRRNELSNLKWAARKLNPQISYKQAKAVKPQQHKDAVRESLKIQELIESLSQQLGVDRKSLERDVANILNEIGYDKKWFVIRLLGFFVVKICQRVCTALNVNSDKLTQICATMGNCPVMLVPSHRSYADFILMSFLCFSENIAVPAITAGMDFHGMWGMGQMLRNTGAFFMRRTYNDDNTYWSTFKQYVHQIVTKGELPIEFFIEGTRSRSNKSLPPKYGLILMVLKAFFLSQVPDVLFIPISISYERIMEEKLFAYELLGIPKPKESTSAFFKSLSIIKEKLGSIYFTFGTPVSARSFFADKKINRAVHNLQPVYSQDITEEERNVIPALAHEIIYRQQKNAVLTAFNLLAIILDYNLRSNYCCSISDYEAEISQLRAVLITLGADVRITGSIRQAIDEALQVHSNVVKLNGQKQIVLNPGDVVMNQQFDASKLKGHGLSQKTIARAVPFMLLQIYVNPIMHYVVDVAILIIFFNNNQRASKDQLIEHYHWLRTLFTKEFVTVREREEQEFEAALTNALQLNFLVSSNGYYEPSSTSTKIQDIIVKSLSCFIYTYFMACVVLLKANSAIVVEKSVMAEIQENIEAEIDNNQRVFIHPYSLNLDTITNCLNALIEHGALRRFKKDDNVAALEVNVEKIWYFKNRLENFVHVLPQITVEAQNLHHLKTKL